MADRDGLRVASSAIAVVGFQYGLPWKGKIGVSVWKRLKISAMKLFDQGYNKLRETTFANQKRLGIMPENAQLTAWPNSLPPWDSLSFEQKKLFIKQADVYGAYLAYTDNEIGRVIQAVEDLGQLDNTLIIYISGDNGARPRAC